MKKYYLYTLASIIITICLQSCKDNVPAQASGTRIDILAANIDSCVNPTDNFFEYANGKWIKNNDIPNTESTWGIANLVNEELYERKRNINIEAVAAQNKNQTQQQIADFWTSAMDSTKIEREALNPLKPTLDKINGLSDINSLLSYSGYLHSIGVNVFFSEGVGQDEKNSEVMSYQLHQGGLSMPNRDYYFNNDNRTKAIRVAFPKYIQSIFEFCGIDKEIAMQKSKAVLNIETQLAKHTRKLEDLRDPYKNYNKMSVHQFSKISLAIPWQSVFANIGLPQIDTVIIGQPEFFTNLSALVQHTSLQELKDYLSFHLINEYASYISSPFVKAKFDFYGTTIRGSKEMRPRWKRVLDAEENAMGEVLGQLFVKEYFDAKAKKRYEDITEAVREAYKLRIEKLNWMSDSTKQKAMLKLKSITKKVGYPDTWKDFSNLNINQTSFASNMMKANQWWNKYYIQKLDKPVDRTSWDMTPQTYNAYYNPSNNEIVLPAGIFTIPGYKDEELDDALVYGYAGASTIGHEITHGFDDQGRQFDAHGNLKNWWSKSDEAQFNQRAKKLVEQFNNIIVLDSMHINGSATLGENLADLGGVLIGLDAFKQSKTYKENKLISGYTPLQRFFLGYTLGWLYKSRKEQLASQLLTDVHSPAQYRVNGIFPNVPDFYNAFKISPNTKMYLPDSARVDLW